jgi:hypothetical protein
VRDRQAQHAPGEVYEPLALVFAAARQTGQYPVHHRADQACVAPADLAADHGRAQPPLLLEEFTSIDAMIKAAIDLASKKGIVMSGNKGVIVAAAPYAPPGQTDFLRVATLNDPL